MNPEQLRALAWAATHKGYVSCGLQARTGLDQRTLKSLVSLGLLVHHASTGYVHGVGARHQYRLTDRGREVARIGRMFAPLAR